MNSTFGMRSWEGRTDWKVVDAVEMTVGEVEVVRVVVDGVVPVVEAVVVVVDGVVPVVESVMVVVDVLTVVDDTVELSGEKVVVVGAVVIAVEVESSNLTKL